MADVVVPRLDSPWEASKAAVLPSRILAYIGDSVFELSIRLWHVATKTDSAGRLHDSVVGLVCAENQARLFETILPTVSPSEQELLKHWRNAKLPYRPSSATRAEYARATALEAWVGYLFLTGQMDRLQDLIAMVPSMKCDEEEKNDPKST